MLSEQGRNRPTDWMIFYSEGSTLANRLGAQGYPYTRKVMEQLQDRSFDAHFSTVGEPGTSDERTLFGMIASGDLPEFSFVEPQWGLRRWPGIGFNGNDYHPPSRLRTGEHFLKDLYDALTANKDVGGSSCSSSTSTNTAGPTTMCRLPGRRCPRGRQRRHTGTGVPRGWIRVRPFRRTCAPDPRITVGCRVHGISSRRRRPYDHTSVIATVFALMGVDKEHWKLGTRVATAPAFDNVLTAQPRTDVPRVETNPAWFA